jgi:hypothetical protein
VTRVNRFGAWNRRKQIAQTFVYLIVQAEAWNGFRPGLSATAEERADAFQEVLDEAGYFAHVEPWEPGTDLSISGLDDMEGLLWFVGLLGTMPRGKFEDEVQHVVERMIRSKKRREDEEETDTTDYETLEEAEDEVQGVKAERPSLWAMIVKLFQSG